MKTLVVAVLSTAAVTLSGQTFTNTGSMNTARYWHSGVLLTSGKVLVAGGKTSAGDSISSAELYDPLTGAWGSAGAMNAARNCFTATLLANGKVLVAGGYNGSGHLSSAELYDPASGTWTPTGSLKIARDWHSAALLPNGNVLVVGGESVGVITTSAELYNPATGTWSPTGALNFARDNHAEILLGNGKVLVMGGSGSGGYLSSAELYNPDTGTWTPTGTMNIATAYPTATLLPNGKVLITGGVSEGTFLSAAELYDPVTAAWTQTSSMSIARAFHSATLLPAGKVLVAGGWMQNMDSTAGAELYDYVTGTWTVGSSMSSPRNHQVAALLPNGQVLIAGGTGNSTVFSSSELYLNTVVAQRLWSAADGGNGHVYELIQSPGQISWTEARDAAVARGGYLATITSAAENAVVAGMGNSSLKWIGGFQPPGSAGPAGGWSWITGEPFNYTHWYYSEPNNGGLGAQNYILLWNGDGGSWWVDADNIDTGGWVTGCFVVEYDGLTASPRILTEPTSKTVGVGSSVSLGVTATGNSPLCYQWRFNGQSIPNATNASLVLTSVGMAHFGGYSVTVSNPYGFSTSATASLKVLADPANGIQTPLPIYPSAPTIGSGKDSLVLITHGRTAGPDSDDDWVDAMKTSVEQIVPSNWMVIGYKWIDESRHNVAWIRPAAEAVGRKAGVDMMTLAQLTTNHKWEHIHLIGHSAGGALINQIADIVSYSSPATTIHTTFLDTYTGVTDSGRVQYGEHSHWSDSYFALDMETADDFVGRTSGILPYAHNVDVTWLDSTHIYFVTNYCSSSGVADSTPASIYETQVPCGVQAYESTTHGWPIEFYQRTITNGMPGSQGYGFPLSKEGGGWANRGNYPANNVPVMLGNQQYIAEAPVPVRKDSSIHFNYTPNATSSAGVSFTGNNGATLFNTLSQPPSSQNGLGDHPLNGPSPTVPAWLSVGLTITNPVNFVQFDAVFADSSSGQGLLTVYWDTNQIGMVDQRVAFTNSQTYRFALPSAVGNDVYALGFRLDSFNDALSSITITNVATGFVGVNQPVALSVALFTNGTPILQLTGASNYNYLVGSSTNLLDWTATALLVSSNGTAFFADRTATNSPAKFYRVLTP